MFDTLDAVRERNAETGKHWFDADTMGFFKTRIPSIPTATGGLVAGRFFVTTEKPPHGDRFASIRCALDDGSVETVGELGEYTTPRAAIAGLYAALDEGASVAHDPYEDVKEPDNPEWFNWRPMIGELPIGVRTTKAKAEEIAAQVAQGLA